MYNDDVVNNLYCVDSLTL